MATAVASALASGALQGVASIINAIRGKNPEDAAKLQELLSKHEDTVLQVQADIAKAQIQENVSLNETAGENIQAEAKSGSYSAAARPSIIYVGLFIMTWNFCVMPMFGIHWPTAKPVNFPDMFWTIWGIVSTGYVFARSADKILGGLGGSVALPFGIKIDSKGDKS